MLTVRNNQFIAGLTMADFQTTRGDTISARSTEALVRSPFFSALRMRELSTLGGRMLPAFEVARRSRAVGLNFDEPMREEKLEALIQRKLAERRRQRIVSTGPQDGFTATLGFFAELATTVVDPLNVASAFIPVVREARFAALSARFGRLGARAIRGTAEGLVGAAVVEPLVLAAATQEQADYGFLDSMLNVTFGAVAGGGLHVGGGKIADLRRTRKTRRMSEVVALMDRTNKEQTLKAAIANVNEGVMPNPDLHLREDASVRGEIRTAVDRRLDEGADIEDLIKEGLLTPDEAKNLQFEERMTIRERNQSMVVEDVSSKLQKEVDRINSPKSDLLQDVDGAREADARAPELAAKKHDVAEVEELLDSAEEDVKAAARAFLEEADESLLDAVGLTRTLDDVRDLVEADIFIAETKQQKEAIDALVACMKRG